MSSSLGCNAGDTIDSESQIDDHSAQQTLCGNLKEIVCFGEVMYHEIRGIYHELMLQNV